ncbi:MAG: TPM domain-containing protein, partial [Gemmatimonadetes bacterium]|nr:TPM domain-containing protein [Gemmatimonadota bacterium]
MILLPILTLVQLQLPEPVGFVNDFANVISPGAEQAMDALIREVRQKSGGEIVVVTLPDLMGEDPFTVALEIGRKWGVGTAGSAGDPARNTGVVLLLKPGARPGDGRSDLFIAPGTGAEGFITDARAGRIRDAIGAAAAQSGDFSTGLVVGVQMLAEAYAAEFAFELTGGIAQAPRPQRRRGRPFPVQLIFLMLFFFMMLGGRRGRYGRRYVGSGAGQLLLLSMLLLMSLVLLLVLLCLLVLFCRCCCCCCCC